MPTDMEGCTVNNTVEPPLRSCATNAGGMGLLPDQKTKLPHAGMLAWPNNNNKMIITLYGERW